MIEISKRTDTEGNLQKSKMNSGETDLVVQKQGARTDFQVTDWLLGK